MSERRSNLSITPKKIFFVLNLADLSKRLEKISRDIEAQALALNKRKPKKGITVEQQVKPQLFLVKEAAVS